MRREKWADAPHEKLFWAAIIVIVITSMLIFAKQVAGL